MRNQIIQGNALESDSWKDIPDQHVQTCITSPPYWGLRDYGVEGQLGLEKTPEEFVERMVQVFRHVRRILRDDGTLWLNLGDSYTGGKTGRDDKNDGGGLYNGKQAGWTGKETRNRKVPTGLKPKDLCGIPWRVALALQADGWYLRQDIIWHKPNPMPESVRDRCTKAHEYMFLLTKKPRYFCDMEAIKDPAATDWTITQKDRVQRVDATGGAISGGTGDVVSKGTTRNKRSVWTVTTKPYKEAHFATFPPKLIEPCVLAGTSEKGQCYTCGTPWSRVVEKTKSFQSGSGKSGNPISGKNGSECQGGGDTGDIRKGPVTSTKTVAWTANCDCDAPQAIPQIVFDPFMGSGTTGMVAKMHGRDYLGLELNPEYIELIHKRIKEVGHPLFEASDE
jgi:DNA modification methylase